MNNYSFLQKKLHRLVLGNKFLKKSLFEIEKNLFLKNDNFKNNSHIFITGLPRSGTTSLLNFFYNTEEYASLTYKDMPFILSPNFFSKFANKKKIKKKERIHNDGIEYDQNSPDTFDEILFTTYKEKEIENNYIDFVNLVLKRYSKKKYLSKNNNNYKRIDKILNFFPNASILIPFREPLQHANSLISKHILFSKQQKLDHFVLEYMNFLGHHEFGNNHISWFKSSKFDDFNNFNYWLEQWLLFYSHLEKKILNKYENVFFIDYENLCKKDIAEEILIKKFKINKKGHFKFSFSEKRIEFQYDQNLYTECDSIYKKLKNSSLI